MTNHLTLQVKRFDPSLPLPEYKTAGAAGFDLCARLEAEVPAMSYARVHLNVAIALPEGFWAMLVARSSLHKKGLMMANGVGVIDGDYRGDEDEYVCVLYNFTDASVLIEKGERVAQVVIVPGTQLALEEVATLGQSRGGFGTTGNK